MGNQQLVISFIFAELDEILNTTIVKLGYTERETHRDRNRDRNRDKQTGRQTLQTSN